MPPVNGFPYTHREPVRFRDLDAMGHVNNAVVLTFLEQARFAYLESLGLVERLDRLPMILARVEIDYRAQIEPGDDVEIGVRCARVETKSFELEHRLEACGRHVADARTVLVAFDYERQEPVAVSEEWRQALAAEGVPA
jgi:acyl-CoA thioester hydrolase